MTVTDHEGVAPVALTVSWWRLALWTALCTGASLLALALGGRTWQDGLTGAVAVLFAVITVSNATSVKPVGWRWIVFSYPMSLIALLAIAVLFGISSLRSLAAPVDITAVMAALGHDRLVNAAIPVGAVFLGRSRLVMVRKRPDDAEDD